MDLEGSISLCGISVRATWKLVSFAGNPEGYGEGGSGKGHHFPWRPRWGARGLSTGDLGSRLLRRA